MIKKPINVEFNRVRQTSILSFRDGSDGEYRMRGGVCWPITIERGGVSDVEGYILMSGQNVDTRKITVFEQKKFVVIDHILRPDRSIEYEGLSPWFNRCWSKYFARDFFWHQSKELTKNFRLEVTRSAMINPKPQFIEVPWSDDAETKHIVWRFTKTHKLEYDKGSQVHVELDLIKKGEKQTLASFHALTCMLAGIDRFPIR